ncbi:hypothetical protein BX666DRAFT_2121866 [Dichotomocladium elegans]|nr:hypothetical protein BX666DRAFT_2121866 [Dichotomocladium elegans]
MNDPLNASGPYGSAASRYAPPTLIPAPAPAAPITAASAEPGVRAPATSEEALLHLYFSAEAKNLPVPKSQPGPMSINRWLNKYESACNDIGMNSAGNGPTYGVDPAAEAAQVRAELQALHQDNMPIRLFRVKFETLVHSFPPGHVPSDSRLLDMFVANLNPALRQLVVPLLFGLILWEDVYDRAVFHKDRLSRRPEQPPAATTFQYQANTPAAARYEPMEIDAISHQQQSQPRLHQQPKHQQQRAQQQSQQPPASTDWPKCKEPQTVRPLCANVAAITTESPAVPPPSVPPSSQYPPAPSHLLSALTKLTAPGVSYTGPRVSCVINHQTIQALVDTGASISAMSHSLAKTLGLTFDETTSVSFTTADGKAAFSLGTASVRVLAANIPITVTFHIIDLLSRDKFPGGKPYFFMHHFPDKINSM